MTSGSLKGAEWEREAAKLLSLWITGGADKSQLARTRSSGGWQTGAQGQDGWRHAGDLAPNGPAGEMFRKAFVVECKHTKGFDLWHIFNCPSSEWLKWIPKLEEEGIRYNLCPWLMVKPHGKGTYVIVPVQLLHTMGYEPALTFVLPQTDAYGVLPWKEVQAAGTAEDWVKTAHIAGWRLR